MSGDPSGPLRRRFVWLVVLTAVPVLIALALLGMREMHAARAAVLAEPGEARRLRAGIPQQLAADVDTHTSVMRALAEQCPA